MGIFKAIRRLFCCGKKKPEVNIVGGGIIVNNGCFKKAPRPAPAFLADAMLTNDDWNAVHVPANFSRKKKVRFAQDRSTVPASGLLFFTIPAIAKPTPFCNINFAAYNDAMVVARKTIPRWMGDVMLGPSLDWFERRATL